LITSIGIALDRYPVHLCWGVDSDEDGVVGVDEVVAGVSNAWGDCSAF
jgi:hypothetical protein